MIVRLIATWRHTRMNEPKTLWYDPTLSSEERSERTIDALEHNVSELMWASR